MAYLLGVLIVVFGLLISIGLHEIGHLVPAKKFGVRVPQYMIGFGPTIWSTTRGETEYGVKLIPLGGYVRLVGMYPPGDPRRASKKGRLAEFVQSARDASMEEVRPGEEHRAFYNLSAPKKLIVMFGGPFMNLVIAFVLLSVLYVGFGQMTPTTTLASVSQCVLAADAPADATCSENDPVAPAAAAGLQPGDTITAWNGTQVQSWDELSALIQRTGGQEVDVTFTRDGVEHTTSATPIVAQRPEFNEDGTAALDSNGDMVTHPVGFMGMGASTELVSQSITQVPGALGEQLAGTAKIIGSLPARLVDITHAAFGHEERDANSVVGIVGIGRFAGELASTQGLNTPQYVAANLIGLVVSLNIALFAFNMVPLPPLDGGHIASALYEGARRRVVKLAGRGYSGPADTARLLPLTYTVFILLTGMSVLLIYADIVNPVKLFG